MGGSISAGRNNAELVHNLATQHAKTSLPHVEEPMLGVDRRNYFLPGFEHFAYQDQAWRHNQIHLSAPVIYWEVLDLLQLKPGLSFLNLGSGTGYLSTMAALVLGPHGVNHGVELHQEVIDFALEKLDQFKQSSESMDRYDICEPVFVQGNCLNLPEDVRQYDRVYCGAACPDDKDVYMKNLIKVGGILVMPYRGYLVQIKRVAHFKFKTNRRMQVAFSSLQEPTATDETHAPQLPHLNPKDLRDLARTRIRQLLRNSLDLECPEVTKLKKFVPKVDNFRILLNKCLQEEDEELSDEERVSNVVISLPSSPVPLRETNDSETNDNETMEDDENRDIESDRARPVEIDLHDPIRGIRVWGLADFREYYADVRNSSLQSMGYSSVQNVEDDASLVSNPEPQIERDSQNGFENVQREEHRIEHATESNEFQTQSMRDDGITLQESQHSLQRLVSVNLDASSDRETGELNEIIKESTRSDKLEKTDEENELKEKLKSVLKVKEDGHATENNSDITKKIMSRKINNESSAGLNSSNQSNQSKLDDSDTELDKLARNLDRNEIKQFTDTPIDPWSIGDRALNAKAKTKSSNISKHDLQESSSKHDLKESSSKHDLQESSSKHDLKESSSKHGLQESSSKHDLKESSSKHDLKESSSKHALQESSSKHDLQESSSKHDLQESTSSFVLNDAAVDPNAMDGVTDGVVDCLRHEMKTSLVKRIMCAFDMQSSSDSSSSSRSLKFQSRTLEANENASESELEGKIADALGLSTVSDASCSKEKCNFKREKFDSGVVDDESSGDSSSVSESGVSNDSALDNPVNVETSSAQRLQRLRSDSAGSSNVSNDLSRRFQSLSRNTDQSKSLGEVFGDGVRTFLPPEGRISSRLLDRNSQCRFVRDYMNERDSDAPSTSAHHASESRDFGSCSRNSKYLKQIKNRILQGRKLSTFRELQPKVILCRPKRMVRNVEMPDQSKHLSTDEVRELQAFKQKINEYRLQNTSRDVEMIDRSERLSTDEDRNLPTVDEDGNEKLDTECCDTDFKELPSSRPRGLDEKSISFSSIHGQSESNESRFLESSEWRRVNSRLNDSASPLSKSEWKRKHAADSEQGDEDEATTSHGAETRPGKRNKKSKEKSHTREEVESAESDQRREDFLVRVRDCMIAFSDDPAMDESRPTEESNQDEPNPHEESREANRPRDPYRSDMYSEVLTEEEEEETEEEEEAEEQDNGHHASESRDFGSCIRNSKYLKQIKNRILEGRKLSTFRELQPKVILCRPKRMVRNVEMPDQSKHLSTDEDRELQAFKQKINEYRLQNTSRDVEMIDRSERLSTDEDRNLPTVDEDGNEKLDTECCDTDFKELPSSRPRGLDEKSISFSSIHGQSESNESRFLESSEWRRVNSRLNDSASPLSKSEWKRKHAADSEQGDENEATTSHGAETSPGKRNKKSKEKSHTREEVESAESDQRREDFLVRVRDCMIAFSDDPAMDESRPTEESNQDEPNPHEESREANRPRDPYRSDRYLEVFSEEEEEETEEVEEAEELDNGPSYWTLMRERIQALPLPTLVKLYLNYGREL